MTAYRSIFQRRTRPVTCIDFEKTANLKVSSEYFTSPTVEEDIEKWNQRIPFLPQDVARLFEASFAGMARLHIVFDGRYKGRHNVSLYLTDLLDRRFAKLLFTNNIDESPSTEITVREENRGQGIGTKWFSFVNELSLMLGHERRMFEAGSSNGGYTWAKAGAYTDMSPTKHTSLTHLREKLLLRLDSVKPFIKPDIYHSMRPFCRVLAKDDLCKVASTPYVLPEALCRQMEDWRRGDFYNSLKQVFNDKSQNFVNERDHASNVVCCARMQGVPLTLGRYLLSHTTWDAYVDFSDKEQIERIGGYVGGCKTISPVQVRNAQPSATL